MKRSKNRLRVLGATKIVSRRRLEIESLESRRVLAAVNLVHDFNQESMGDDVSIIRGRTGGIYFVMDTPEFGAELWKSDGTPGGSVLVKDIYPGQKSSQINNMVNFAGATYFAANGGTGLELWKTDGTTAGTVLVKEINATGSSYSALMTVMGGQLYFVANDGTHGTELWRSDGTTAGTSLFLDLYAGSTSSFPSDLVATSNYLFFSADTPAFGREMWRTDGTAGGTIQLKDFVSGVSGSNFQEETAVNNSIFFITASDLWVSDGTVLGTSILIDNSSGITSISGLTNVGGTLYFTASNAAAGKELWRSNGTPASTILVKDINPTGSSYPAKLTNVNGTLFFSAEDSAGLELWKSNGTGPSTVRVADIASGASSSFPSNLTNVNGTLFFTAQRFANDVGIWKSDGSAAGTVLVEDEANYARPYTSATYLTNGDGALYFKSFSIEYGPQLWHATTSASHAVDFNSSTDGSQAKAVMAMSDKVLVLADSSDIGSTHMLWQSDGSDNVTLVSDSGTLIEYEPTIVIDDILYFVSQGDLWRSDGTPGGTFLLKDLTVSSGYFHDFTNVNGTLYFAVEGSVRHSIWKSDGTTNGTLKLFEYLTFDTGDALSDLKAVGNTLYFVLETFDLMKSDGTPAGTELVMHFNGGISDLELWNNTLYILGQHNGSAFEFWKTDGTAAGTLLISDINASPSALLFQLTPASTQMYFEQATGKFGRSDGTAAGTTYLKTFQPYPGDVPPMTVIGDVAYFLANDGTSGFELWKSDGTVAGTVLVKDIWPGLPSGNPRNLTVVNGKLFFSANDGVHGEELWTSDGTAAGTLMRSELVPGSGGSNPANFMLVGSKLFMTATTHEASRELFMQSTDLHVTLTGAGPRSTAIRRKGSWIEVVDTITSTVIDSLETDYIRSVTFEGVASVDSVTIDYAFGGFFSLPDGIKLFGAAGTDTLNIVGTNGIMATYNGVGGGVGQGSVTIQQGAFTNTIAFNAFESLSITGMLSVATSGNVSINAQSLTVGSLAPLNLSNVTALNTGTLNSSSTIALGAGELLMGSGVVNGRLAGEVGSSIVTTGAMSIGLNTSSAGFITHGEVQVTNTLTLLDANQAVLGSLTTLGDGVLPGNITATNGLLVDFGNNVIGNGTITTPNNSAKPFVNNGEITGNSVAQPILLTGYIKGVGSLTNVNIAGTYSPGFSPAMVSVGTVVYGPGSQTVIELGGPSAGTGYDQINHIGQAFLGGTLDVQLIDGFMPSLGNSFTILTASVGLVGSFASINLPTLANGLQWQLVNQATSIQLLVVQANLAPSDLTLSSSSLTENTPGGAVVGIFATVDGNANDTFTYALVSGAGSDGNGSFAIDASGNLHNQTAFDFETQATYRIRVRTTDQGGLFFEQVFNISVIDLPELVGLPQFGDGTAQRSLIKQMVITFDGAIDILPNAFSVDKRGAGGGQVSTTAAAVINANGQTVVTLNFSGVFTRAGGALVDGFYQLSINGGRILRNSFGLDSDQNGIGGDTFVRGAIDTDNFFALFGDTNGDGLVGIAEFGQFRTAFGKLSNDPGYNVLFDYDGDGAVGISDFGQFRSRFGKPKFTS